MKFKLVIGGLVLAAALGGCKKGGSADLDAFIKLDTDKAAAFSAGGSDCEAKAKSVGAWRTAHTKDYKALQAKLKDAWPKGPPQDVIEKYGDQMKANKKAVIDAMMACSSNEAFGKMMDDTKSE